MEAGDSDLAAQQLASVASILLEWMRVDADNCAFGVPLSEVVREAVEFAHYSKCRDELEPALHAVLARAALARAAARLACTSKAVHDAVCQHNADLVGAAGAARCAQAAAMARIADAACSVLLRRKDERIYTGVASLCEAPGDAADWKELADDVEKRVKEAVQATASAMFGVPFANAEDNSLEMRMIATVVGPTIPSQLADVIANILKDALGD